MNRHLTLLLLLVPYLLIPASVQAFGPLTHMREGDTYLFTVRTNGPEDQMADLELIEDGDNLFYFQLGTMWPDIRSVIDDLGWSTHDRDFALFMLEQAHLAQATEPWKVAFARGNLQHVASDISAQMFVTPALAIEPGLGETDLFDGMYDTHPGGENELLVEGAIDLYYGDLALFVDVLDFFILDWVTQDTYFWDVVDFWYDCALLLYGDVIIDQSDLYAQLSAYVEDLQRYRMLIRKWMLVGFLENMREDSLGEILAKLMPIAQSLLNREGVEDLSMDMTELQRLENTPFFADPNYFRRYFDHFEDLGAFIHWEMETYGLWYETWPVWDATTMLSTGLQSLAMTLPQRFEGSQEAVIYRAFFTDPSTGRSVSTISPDSPPAQLTAQIEVFGAIPVVSPVTMRVMRDLPGGYTADARCSQGTASGDLDYDPYDGNDTPRLVLEATFDPLDCLTGAAGLYLEVLLSDQVTDLPFYSANWEAYEGAPNRDLTQAPYQSMYVSDATRSGYVTVSGG